MFSYSYPTHDIPHCTSLLLQVFVPSTEEREVHFMRYSWYRLGFVAVQQLLGWPMYLFFNASGREYSRWASHFDPTSPIFSKRERAEVRAPSHQAPAKAAAAAAAAAA
jgi:hypothetical protein